MMNMIFSDYIYLTLFYLGVILPFLSLILSRAFCSFQKKISGLDRGWFTSLFHLYVLWCIASLFAASLAYQLITTKTGSYYFMVHFFLLVPLTGVLSGVLFSRIRSMECTKDFFIYSTIFLNGFSFLISFIYMGLKIHPGIGG